jgi:hypothetical protein
MIFQGIHTLKFEAFNYTCANLPTREWRKLHNEELNDLYSSRTVVRMIKSRRMRWAGHVALMGRVRACTVF